MEKKVWIATESFIDDVNKGTEYCDILGVFDTKEKADEAALVAYKSMEDRIVEDNLYYEGLTLDGGMALKIPYVFGKSSDRQLYVFSVNELTMNDSTTRLSFLF